MNKSDWIAGCATIIAFLSLLLVVYTAHKEMERNYLLTKPVLYFNSGWSLDGFHLTMYNNGTGPAIIEWFEVSVDNIPQSNWIDFFKTLEIEDPQYRYTVAYSGNILHPQIEQKLVRSTNSDTSLA